MTNTMQSKYSWMKGFISIVKNPHEFGMSAIEEPYKVLVAASLLETIASISIAYLHRLNPVLISQNIAMMSPWMSKKQLVGSEHGMPSVGELDFSQVLLSTLFTSFVGILAFGALLTLFHWLLGKQKKPLYEITALGAYASGCYALGTLINGLFQFLFSDLRFGIHAGIAIVPTDHPFFFAVLSRVNVLWIISYILASYAIVGHAFVEKVYGRYVSAIVITIIICWFSLFSSIGSYISR